MNICTLFSFATCLPQSAQDIVRKLLKINKSKRLGKTAGGAGGVMKHKWFSGFDWEGLLKRQLEVPVDPMVRACVWPKCLSLCFVPALKLIALQ